MEKNRRLRILIAALIFVGACYRYWPLDFPLGPCHIGYESLEVACSLAQNESFSDPFMFLKTGPTAHVAPLFPMMVSLLIKWLGDGPASMNAVQWVGTFVLAFQLALWPWFAEWLGMGFASGVVGASGWVLVGFVHDPMWESLYVALLILILMVCMRRILSEQVSTLFASLSGALWGILFLLNPVTLLPYLGFSTWIAFSRRIRRVQKLALIIIPFAIISPWIVRNYRVFHHFIFIRDNLGIELSITNNPCSTFSFHLNRWSSCYHHPNESVDEARKVLASGEYVYNQAKLQEASAWIGNNPGRFATLTWQRFLAFWFYTPGRNYLPGQHIPAGILIIWLAMPLSIAGLWMLFKTDRISAGLCLVWLILFPPIYYFLAFIPRYRYPILWASLMPASFFLCEVAQRIWQRARKSTVAPAAPEISVHGA
jgi:hypothetical protein